MCDTFVALADATTNGSVIFGKNSDRPSGEIQDVVAIAAHDHEPGKSLDCTYRTIPQISHTHAVILSKPRWMWGAEMGVNEYQVAIGNEAVWTTQPYRAKGLLGMDLVRLGLERGASAREALQVIVDLLAEFEQGGNCSDQFEFTYHNSFLIADPAEAWVLETAGEFWVAEHVTSGTRSISNGLTIRNAGDLRHPNVVEWAIAQNLCQSQAKFDFAALFSEGGVSDVRSPQSRAGRVQQLCQTQQGKFTIETAQSILRDHEGGVCMHGAFESRGSQVSVLSNAHSQHWFIDHPFPCQCDYQLYTL